MKKIKIEIKTFAGTLLFKYSSTDNTIKKTMIKAVSTGADLTGAYLRGADLRGADLTGAYLRGADLTGAYLRGADLTGAYLTGAYLTGADLTGAYLTGAYLRGAYLRGAYLTGAYLRGAYLTGADLTGAYLRGADLRGADLTGAYLTGAYLRGADLTGAYLTGADGNKIKIKKATVITGLYKYVVIPFISDKGEKWVSMGCYTRTVKEWNKDFWNNKSEFPNDKSLKSQLRVFAYKTAKDWLKLNSK